MQIHGPTNVSGTPPVNVHHKLHSPQPAAPKPHMTPVDQLDISHEAEMVSRTREVPDVRHELVARVKAEIEAGTYETEEKLDIAVGRLLDELSG
jgi:anti-sigma28 factor (negative regulator of flagellin synthesis)